ncbi:MAG: hypothetical protein U9P61_01095 [Patescibacteria group bacterium]|nr:hypothetical protein [Patescibacteria group bacterium]
METLKKQSLFWDVDLKEIDPENHKNFIARRIFGRGDLEDLNWAIDFYGLDLLKDIFLKEAHKIDYKSQNFWLLYFNIDKKECTKK